MAQDFERNIARNIGTSASTIFTADSDDAVVGINLANVTTNQIKASVFVTNSSADYYLVKDAPIPVGSSLELMAGNKVVLETTDQLTIDCDVADKLSGALSIMEIT